MGRFAHDDIVPYEHSGLEKKQQVARMFDSISRRYDFLNRFLSAGIDIRWRKKALAQLKEVAPQQILDVATGTADVAIMAARTFHPRLVTGIDISEGMLQEGRKKVAAHALDHMITLQYGDSETIDFADNTFDAVTVAFGVRNFQDLEKGVAEMLRVLAPGGKLVVLEFSRPKQKVFRVFYNFYMRFIAPKAGGIFARNEAAYRYLNDSVQAFPEREDFTRLMEQTGFTSVYFKPLTFGICCIYCGSKRP